MIYMLRGIYDLMCSAFTGGWWFAQQEALDLEPVSTTTAPASTLAPSKPPHESDILTYEDDGEPLPPPTGEGRPACKSCGDPNFSLESELCVVCRSIGRP